MQNNQEIQKLLEELKKETGIEFLIKTENQGGCEATLLQMQNLLDAYRSKYDREYLLTQVLEGSAKPEDIRILEKKHHIDVDVRRTVFLIRIKGNSAFDIQALLRNLFYSSNHNYVAALAEQQYVLLKSWKKAEEEEPDRIADQIVDILNTEAMVDAKVAYGSVVDSLENLDKSYREACTALEIGTIFYMEQKVFSYRKLGVGRLLYELPLPVCRSYLKEVFDKDVLDILDEETIGTIHAFFDAGLNVSEAARTLYIHRNTLVYRLEKLQKLTGLDIRSFEDAMTYKISAMVASYIHFRERENTLGT